MPSDISISHSCVSCQSPFTGSYCSQCGEKKLQPDKDFSIRKFLAQTIDGIFHLDSKFWKTIKLLLFQPGQLTVEYLAGRRVPYMKPIPILLVCSLLFYFFMPHSGSFYSSYDELSAGFDKPGFSLNNPFKYDIRGLLRSKAGEANPGLDLQLTAKEKEIYQKAYEKAANNSKTFLVLLIPIWAVMIFVLFRKQYSFYVPHLVFAIHLFSFFLLVDLAFLLFWFKVVRLQAVGNFSHMLPFFALVLAFFILAVKNFYKQPWPDALWKGLSIYLLLLVMLLLYRMVITITAIYWA